MSKQKIMEEPAHYSDYRESPIDFILRMNLDFVQGNILKYIMRHKMKDGKKDLAKAEHYAMIGLKSNHAIQERTINKAMRVKEFVENNNIHHLHGIITSIVEKDYQKAIILIKSLITAEYE